MLPGRRLYRHCKDFRGRPRSAHLGSPLGRPPSRRATGLLVARRSDRLRHVIALIAAVYIGFAVADGRPAVIAVETTVAGAFVVLAAAGVTGSAWLIVIGFVGHGLKDLWQHRSHFVANTRWWPPFCMTVDFVAAAIIAVAIVSGVTLHQ